jgi:AcrR family transcriptional regulator
VSDNFPAVSTVAPGQRLSAEERREAVLEAARDEFASAGFHGTSTETIAVKAGISQPYLFRLFGTKKELFLASVRRCFRETLETFQRAAEGKRGQEALDAMGEAYRALLADRSRLLLQMQAHAACDDPDVREAVQQGFGDVYTWIERVSGESDEQLTRFFAFGMLLNVVAAMDLLDSDEGWAKRLTANCQES